MTELLKVVHIAAISVWCAGLLCLPSLYIQRRSITRRDDLHRLQKMVRYAYIAVVSPLAFIAVASGIILIFTEKTFAPWFAAKLAFVGLMAFFHVLMGLVVIRLFRDGEEYPIWRFALATLLTGTTITCILWLVLAKPEIPTVSEDIFRPGALRELLAPINPWTTP